MPDIITAELMRKIFPKMTAEQAQIFVAKQGVMAEILATSKRFALCCSHLQVETAGFNNSVVRNLTENTNYRAENVVKNWKHRYPSVAAVQAKFGTAPGWQIALFDEIYGYEPDGKTPRMGNRPGTHDGSTYIGRGAPQITGRDGYMTIGKMIGADLVNNPQLTASPELQPDIIAAYWRWKKLSRFADVVPVDIRGSRKAWNGGNIGLSVVEKCYPKFLNIIASYQPTTAAVNVQPVTVNVDETLKGFQRDLIGLGYFEIGDEDGRLGGRTQGAIKAFLKDRGVMDVSSNYPGCSDVLSNALNDALKDFDKDGKPWHRPIAPKRAYATAEEIAPNVASIAPTKSAGLFAKIGAWFTGTAATGKAAFLLTPDLNSDGYPYVTMIKEIWNDIPDWVFPAAIFIIAIIIVRQTTKAKTETVSAYQQGKIN